MLLEITHALFNICRVLRKLIEQKAAGRVLKYLLRGPAKINAMKQKYTILAIFMVQFENLTEKPENSFSH